MEETQPTQAAVPSATTFPAPLVLPGDDIALDPRYPPQSLLSWIRSKDCNEVRSERNTIYVVAPLDEYPQNMQFIESWTHPQLTEPYKQPEPLKETSIPSRPRIEDLMEYLSAFYHGLPVKRFEANVAITTWEDKKPGRRNAASKYWRERPKYVGFSTGSEVVRIRTRQPLYQPFAMQLNLNDLLDAAISMLPADAYALLMLVNHDIFEDADDDFACGRAYGGSRVAVVSTARYNPCLDEAQSVERQHGWPASHCAAYMEKFCADASAETAAATHSKKKRNVPKTAAVEQPDVPESPPSQAVSDMTPIEAAVSAFKKSDLQPTNPYPIYLSRVCRTASHELGHCFGLDHCMYYACAMQGTASLAEDARQPPYLCPVDLKKVLRATGSTVRKRYRALLDVCAKWGEEGTFAAHAAWIRGMLKGMEAGVLERDGEGDVRMSN